MIAKRRLEQDDSVIIQLIRDELLPLARRRFPDSKFNKAEFMQRLSNGTTYLWKLRMGRIVGFIHLFIQDQIIWLDMIAVHRMQQGKGIGRKLVQHAILYGKAHHMHAISLYVDESNQKAFRLYKSLGFHSVQYHPQIYCYELTMNL